jgi:hypothetical protein
MDTKKNFNEFWKGKPKFIDGKYLRKANSITVAKCGKTFTESETYIQRYAIQLMVKEGVS